MEGRKQNSKKVWKTRGSGDTTSPEHSCHSPQGSKISPFWQTPFQPQARAELRAFLQPRCCYSQTFPHSPRSPLLKDTDLHIPIAACSHRPLLRNTPGYQGNVLSSIWSEPFWLFDAEHTPFPLHSVGFAVLLAPAPISAGERVQAICHRA